MVPTAGSRAAGLPRALRAPESVLVAFLKIFARAAEAGAARDAVLCGVCPGGGATGDSGPRRVLCGAGPQKRVDTVVYRCDELSGARLEAAGSYCASGVSKTGSQEPSQNRVSVSPAGNKTVTGA